nr:beta-galactosidase 6 [Quercus suber]
MFRYHIPRTWVHPGENLLVLHEELGVDPSKISLLTRTGQEICAHVSEADPPPADSWKPNQEFKSQIPEVRLNCEQGWHINMINFASFGTPRGNCASGDSESPVSKVAPNRGKISSAFTDALSFKMEAGLPDGAANAAEVNDSGFIGEAAEVNDSGFIGEATGCVGMGADILALMTMGLGPAAAKEMPIESKSVDSLRVSQWVDQNRMDELFTLYVHHGGYFDVNPQKLWYRSPEDNEEDGVFQLIKDDHDAMAMTKLVRGHGQIHVYVEHPVYEPILINDGNGLHVDTVVGPDHDDPFVVSDSESCSSSELECSCDGYYNGQGYYANASSGDNFEDDDSDDGDRNDDNDDEVEILECRRPGKEPIVEEPQQDGAVTTDSNDSSEDSDVEGARSMNPNQRNVGEDSASSDSEDLMHMREQIGDGVMNSDYTTEELLSLSESSSDGGFQGDGIYDNESDATVNETVVDNVKRKRNTFPVFRLVSNPDDLVFEKHMLFTSAKQFKEAITEYAVKGGWGVKFVKNDKVRVRAKCQPPCKFTAYLAKLLREMSWQLKTLNMEHTCTRSYKNPRCSANFIAKKLMKKVRRQPDIKLRRIQRLCMRSML